jgi:hypothetical protein
MFLEGGSSMKRARLGALGVAVIATCAVVALTTGVATNGVATASGGSSCQLGTKHARINHVIYLQFDNTHYKRDVANVPSDLEQMPHLLSFLRDNGTLLTNDHTILISHTGGGIVSTLTGLYPDRNGQTVSNSYGFFKPDGSIGFSSTFKYWTDVTDATADPLPNMVGDGGQTAPEPWVTYTHAGCNVGGVSAANIELENNKTDASGDMTRVFGEGSPEWNEAKDDPTKAQADFVGIAIHCAKGQSPCAGDEHARPDDRTIYPGSDDGYQALFGARYVNPAITGGDPCVQATDGSDITDPAGNCGFPGFDGALAKNTLGEIAQMQEHGVPVTFAYISDAHDNHTLVRASGPGEADYKQQLADYDAAFAAFFKRLADDGIDKSNTLFVVTVDEGDHFAGGPGTPDGSGSLTYAHTPCAPATETCPSNQIGEITTNLAGLLPAGEAPFSVHSDDAPTIYVNGNPPRTDPSVRKLGRDISAATAIDPYKNATVPITVKLADSVGEAALHMVNSDPRRTPTLTLFGDDDFFFQVGNSRTCSPAATECVDPKFAWNHGDNQPEIANTWLGMVGPGVDHNGIDNETWSDHVDVRPTMNALLGLSDDYLNDGRVITQIVDDHAEPKTLDKHDKTVLQLGTIYKQLNAPFGTFAQDLLTASTTALAQPDTQDGNLKYDSIESQMATLTLQRDVLAGAIRQALNDAAKGVAAVDKSDANGWIAGAEKLLNDAHQLSTTS